MISKAIGYLIGGLFMILLLVPIGLQCRFVGDRANVMLTTSTVLSTDQLYLYR